MEKHSLKLTLLGVVNFEKQVDELINTILKAFIDFILYHSPECQIIRFWNRSKSQP